MIRDLENLDATIQGDCALAQFSRWGSRANRVPGASFLTKPVLERPFFQENQFDVITSLPNSDLHPDPLLGLGREPVGCDRISVRVVQRGRVLRRDRARELQRCAEENSEV